MSYHDCPQAFLPYLAMVNNPIIRSCDLDIWPMTLKFCRVPCGCQGTCARKMLSSYVQRFMSYRGYSETNTIRSVATSWTVKIAHWALMVVTVGTAEKW